MHIAFRFWIRNHIFLSMDNSSFQSVSASLRNEWTKTEQFGCVCWKFYTSFYFNSKNPTVLEISENQRFMYWFHEKSLFCCRSSLSQKIGWTEFIGTVQQSLAQRVILVRRALDLWHNIGIVLVFWYQNIVLQLKTVHANTELQRF